MHTFIHRWLFQACGATASWSGTGTVPYSGTPPRVQEEPGDGQGQHMSQTSALGAGVPIETEPAQWTSVLTQILSPSLIGLDMEAILRGLEDLAILQTNKLV